jgi:hypothetical protein
MSLNPIGIAIPICFSTSKLSRRKSIGSPKALSGYIEIYFSPDPFDPGVPDYVAPPNASQEAEKLYRKHHVYGDHQFLVPASHRAIPKYEAPSGMRFGFEQIGNDPTTAVLHETLQLVPCSQHNLHLFKDRIQSQPFYIEITDRAFVLHVNDKENTYRKIPSQLYPPRCWQGFAHPAISLDFRIGAKPFSKLDDVPWQDLAQQLGR